MIAPGEVRLVWFPFSRNEAEPYKKRPVLVLAAHGTAPDEVVLVTMITSNPQRFARPHSGDIPLVDWQQFGLPKPSVARCRRVWTAEARDFTGAPLGSVSADILEKVKAELRALLA
ncbi:hypothetical protein BJF78_24720 [Pseudonocardia sp. CNS-139]|nr:hypothetical protein BJF78_24720 [Pseudonocardia sp. CNS-139]